MRPIERQSPIPAYYQIALHLRTRILGQEWRSGQRIPPEETLAVEYGVSRVTMRQALAELVKDGLLARAPGARHVCQTTCRNRWCTISRFPSSLPDNYASSATSCSTRCWKTAVFATPLPQVAEHLKISSGQPVAYLERRLMINDQPVAINRSWFSEGVVPRHRKPTTAG